MSIRKRLNLVLYLLALAGALATAGCATAPSGTSSSSERDIAALARGLRALGADVDPEEAQRAAHIAVTYSRQLAHAYGVTDPPLVHNLKVNLGLRRRGLCWQWADDLEARLRAENFRTLDLHRAIANAFNPILIDHSTVIVSRRGDGLFEGMVLDPWRNGGVLYWAPTRADAEYDWRPRAEVFELREARLPSPAAGASVAATATRSLRRRAPPARLQAASA